MLSRSSFILFRLLFSALLGLFILLVSGCSTIKTTQLPTGPTSTEDMVVTASPDATKVGSHILAQGGNAVDAAVAVQFALAVTYPRAGNIGGGGFAVVRWHDGESRTLDFREKASRHASRDMYLDADQNVIPGLSLRGHLASGVPGSVQGMYELHRWKGVLPWQQVIQPAIDLATEGFEITADQAQVFNRYQERFLDINHHDIPLTKKEGWNAGDRLQLPDLAATLERIRDQGPEGFYAGRTAQLITQEMESGGGLIDYEDLKRYQAKWRLPLKGTFHDYSVITMGPPSSGGVALIQMLKGLEQFKLNRYEHNSAPYTHLLVEVEKRAYADRATYMGDPDFAPVPVDYLISDAYIDERMAGIDKEVVTPSSDIKEGNVEVVESVQTTHFSIVDKAGNAVGITTTVNSYFGSKVWVDGAGFFLNNEMDDFSAKPGVPNQFGLLGNEANSIRPEKRMLSSMTPTILEKNGDLFMVVGSPGGSTIITTVLQTILNATVFGMSMQEAVDAKRFHHQWMPDIILHETNTFSDAVMNELKLMNYTFQDRGKIGLCDAIMVHENGVLEGGPDSSRGDDTAIGH
ncbi:gamma-glutamyltransferase [Membranicola marinus]|uniref:Glutathione hydrolase proenzyme n=1 Tax=Membranihabitans marinus TaxID=1227546 RepID=A0A953HR57_9BACT|nr:gamma-glutamyltransferase [Membranihabitans marinus]MBY5959749.1 gamma-glutamyltransferase [Membranihabitans marinus]